MKSLIFLFAVIAFATPDLSYGSTKEKLVDLEKAILAHDTNRASEIYTKLNKSYREKWIEVSAGRIRRSELFHRMIIFVNRYEAGSLNARRVCAINSDGVNFNPGGAFVSIQGAFPDGVTAHFINLCKIEAKKHNAALKKEERDRQEEKAQKMKKQEELRLVREGQRRAEQLDREARRKQQEREEREWKIKKQSILESLNTRALSAGYEKFVNTSSPSTIYTLLQSPHSVENLKKYVFGCSPENVNFCGWAGLNRSSKVISQNNEVAIFNVYVRDQSTTFAVEKNGKTYVDNQPLGNGFHTLKGTYTYTTVLGASSTVYLLSPVDI